MTKQYAQVELASSNVVGFYLQDTPPLESDGYSFPEVVPPLEETPPAPPTPKSVLRWIEGGLVWVETSTLAETVAQARARIDSKADSARKSVLIVDTKDLEYNRAKEVAIPFRDAGYTPPVPKAVQSWADAKKWTNGGVPWTAQQAADDIIAAADRYLALLDGIREIRLDAMEHCLAVGEDPTGTHAQVKAIEDQFYLDLKTLMGSA